jgi:hypothetical protein
MCEQLRVVAPLLRMFSEWPCELLCVLKRAATLKVQSKCFVDARGARSSARGGGVRVGLSHNDSFCVASRALKLKGVVTSSRSVCTKLVGLTTTGTQVPSPLLDPPIKRDACQQSQCHPQVYILLKYCGWVPQPVHNESDNCASISSPL